MDELKQIKKIAMDLLARREHSQAELFQKLKAKEFDENDIRQVITELQQNHWQSDERFTEAYIQMRIRRGYGPVRIHQELNERGIASCLIDEYLNQSGLTWLQFAKDARNKKFGSKSPSDFNARAKQMRFLQYRGFTSEQIRKVFHDENE